MAQDDVGNAFRRHYRYLLGLYQSFVCTHGLPSSHQLTEQRGKQWAWVSGGQILRCFAEIGAGHVVLEGPGQF